MRKPLPRRTSEAASDAPDDRPAPPPTREDNRFGRLHDVKTDRGIFRFKDNRRGE